VSFAFNLDDLQSTLLHAHSLGVSVLRRVSPHSMCPYAYQLILLISSFDTQDLQNLTLLFLPKHPITKVMDLMPSLPMINGSQCFNIREYYTLRPCFPPKYILLKYMDLRHVLVWILQSRSLHRSQLHENFLLLHANLLELFLTEILIFHHLSLWTIDGLNPLRDFKTL
jgi:hypothetical protein